MENFYPIKARTKSGDFYEFKVTDVPVYLDQEHFVLLNKNDSPILKKGLCIRGCDIPGIFEGDILEEDGVQYLVRYQRGFFCKDQNNETKYLYELRDAKKVGTLFDTPWPSARVAFPTKMYYKYHGSLIFPKSILGCYEGRILVADFSDKVRPEEIQQDAKLTYAGEKIFFGDLVDGYPVELYYGRPVVKHDNIIYDIVRKMNIKGDIES